MSTTPRVILVEDDDGHATLVQRNLARAGLGREPVRLRDGQDLLDFLHRRGAWAGRSQEQAVVIILDLNMPRLSGMDALRHLKSDQALVRLPVFVLTTSDNPLEIDRCYALGAAACLVKPVDYGAFSEMVERLASFLRMVRVPGEAPPELNGS